MHDEDLVDRPTKERVASRAMILAAVACLGRIEDDAGKPGAEELRNDVYQWLIKIGVEEELEPAESEILQTPLGGLDRKTHMDAGWQSEGMLVVAWALKLSVLPPFFVECMPNDVADQLGFLRARDETPLRSPQVRDMSEI